MGDYRRVDPFKICILLSLLLPLSLIDASSHIGGKQVENRNFYKWEVEYMFWNPDGLENVVMAINGQFPGPTIRAKAGEIIRVELTNKLYTEGVVIHWHGIRQIGTPWADGTASISQCAINPGETFTYRFTVDRPGTYFYHGHYGMQRSAGLYGSLIVDVAEGHEPFHYDDDLNLLLSDWWHASVHHQEVGLSSNPFRWIGEPQTVLINGRGQYDCSLAAKYNKGKECNLSGSEQYAPYILQVHPNMTYRLRIASTTALASLNLAIGGHKMIVVEADGNYVQPFETDDLDIYSGESYSVIINTNQAFKNYWISIGIRGRDAPTPQALTILNYHPLSAGILPDSPPPVTPKWNDYVHSKNFTNNILALMGTPKPPLEHHRRIILLNTQTKLNGFTKWSLNNVSLSLPATPYLGLMKNGLRNGFDQKEPPENFPENYDVMKPPVNPNTTVGNGIYKFELGKTIDVILQNANALKDGVSEIHPWHLHGHDFWILGYGESKFTDNDEKIFNLKNPPFRNSAVIFPYGWTALRFVTDNPGVWAFHCHIEPHLHMGMGVVFAEGIEKLGDIPEEAIACGLTAKKFMKNTKH